MTKLVRKMIRPMIFFLNQADLSSSEAEKTLSHYEEHLLSLRMKTCTQVVAPIGMAAKLQKPMKIIAYKNGDGYRNGKLIVAETFPMVSGSHLTASCILGSNDNGDSSDKKTAVELSDKCPWPVSPIYADKIKISVFVKIFFLIVFLRKMRKQKMVCRLGPEQ